MMIPQRIDGPLLALAPRHAADADHGDPRQPSGRIARPGRRRDRPAGRRRRSGVEPIGAAARRERRPEVLAALCERLVDLGRCPITCTSWTEWPGRPISKCPRPGLELMRALRRRLPGYAVPRYVRETAGQPHKGTVEKIDRRGCRLRLKAQGLRYEQTKNASPRTDDRRRMIFTLLAPDNRCNLPRRFIASKQVSSTARSLALRWRPSSFSPRPPRPAIGRSGAGRTGRALATKPGLPLNWTNPARHYLEIRFARVGRQHAGHLGRRDLRHHAARRQSAAAQARQIQRQDRLDANRRHRHRQTDSDQGQDARAAQRAEFSSICKIWPARRR